MYTAEGLQSDGKSKTTKKMPTFAKIARQTAGVFSPRNLQSETIKQQAAMLAMHAIISNPTMVATIERANMATNQSVAEVTAELAVEFADALAQKLTSEK